MMRSFGSTDELFRLLAIVVELVGDVGGGHPAGSLEQCLAFAPGCGVEPEAHALWIVESVEVLGQSQPGDLRDVVDVVAIEAMANGNGFDKTGVPLDQGLPCEAVTVVGPLDEVGVRRLVE